ncbi:MAG: hypothetical protein PHN94_05565 [Bacteroidales bacterium]|nr:hypothetical protein [Bacteroidales bacterium]
MEPHPWRPALCAPHLHQLLTVVLLILFTASTGGWNFFQRRHFSGIIIAILWACKILPLQARF